MTEKKEKTNWGGGGEEGGLSLQINHILVVPFKFLLSLLFGSLQQGMSCVIQHSVFKTLLKLESCAGKILS